MIKVDSFSGRFFINTDTNKLVYHDGQNTFEMPRDIPLALDELRNLKIEVKALREVAEKASNLWFVDEGSKVYDAGLYDITQLREALDKLDEVGGVYWK